MTIESRRKIRLGLIITTIMLNLAGTAFPQSKSSIQSEDELRHHLAIIRDAIHRYKTAADRGMFQIPVGSQGYPPDLDTLVKGVVLDNGTKLTFIHNIPLDPITKGEWGVRSTTYGNSQGDHNVSDVYCKSEQVASDGTKYKDW